MQMEKKAPGLRLLEAYSKIVCSMWLDFKLSQAQSTWFVNESSPSQGWLTYQLNWVWLKLLHRTLVSSHPPPPTSNQIVTALSRVITMKLLDKGTKLFILYLSYVFFVVRLFIDFNYNFRKRLIIRYWKNPLYSYNVVLFVSFIISYGQFRMCDGFLVVRLMFM